MMATRMEVKFKRRNHHATEPLLVLKLRVDIVPKDGNNEVFCQNTEFHFDEPKKLKHDVAPQTTTPEIHVTPFNHAVLQLRGDYFALSNLFILKAPIMMDGLLYFSVENAFQAAKYPVNDPKRQQFAGLHITNGELKNDPKSMKKLTRREKMLYPKDFMDSPLLQHAWTAHSAEFMRQLLFAKFAVDDEALRCLLNTSGFIGEGNGHDDELWGLMMCSPGASPAAASSLAVGFYGGNKLGSMLMVIREEIHAMRHRGETLTSPAIEGCINKYFQHAL
jgi:predicted NAD-dependent protein-ADP-ribosyltransferase YbiA (DUF1768 family)